MGRPASKLDLDNLVDAETLGKIFGVTRQTVYQLVRKHGLPSIRLTHKVCRFDKAEVQRWVLSKHPEAERNRSTR